MKQSYFKFMSFGPHTRLSLYMLMKHKAIFFAYKNVLNDPTDCSPFFYVEIDDSQLEKRIKEIADDTKSEKPEIIQDALQILEFYNLARPGEIEKKSTGVTRRSRFFRFGYFASDVDVNDIAKAFIAYHMQLQVDEARIFSMSKKHDEPRLWAHYASSHSGFCIEIESLEIRHETIILDRVDYTTRRPRISVNDIKSIKHNEKTRSEMYNRMFFQKSTGWDYEDEQRLVLPKVDSSNGIEILRFPEGDYVAFSKIRIKNIYFGMNSRRENIKMVSSLVDQFSSKSKPNLYKAIQSSDNYEIGFEPLSERDIRLGL